MTGKPKIVLGGKDSERLVSKCPALSSVYYPFVLYDRHVQIAILLLKQYLYHYFRKVKLESEICSLLDGEQVILDWAVSKDPFAESGLISSLSDTPILMIHHGAMGRSSEHVLWVAEAHKRGWIVCFLNRRGHRRVITKPKYNFFGTAADVKYITKHIILSRRPNAKMLMIGISAGSGLLINSFAAEDNLFISGVGICPGYNTEVCMGRCSYPYQVNAH